MKKISIYFLSIFIINFFLQKNVLAVCPLCTIAVSAGIGLSRWLGIDDSISGLWIGGLIVSMIIWTISWLDKKNIKFKGRTVIIILGYYLLILAPLSYSGIIINPFRVLSVYILDKLLLGIVVGSIAFWAGASWYYYLKEINRGKVYFPFQKIILPISPLIILSIIFYFLTKPY